MRSIEKIQEFIRENCESSVHFPKEIAEMFEVTPASVYGWIRKGTLNSQKMRGLVYSTEEQIESFVKEGNG